MGEQTFKPNRYFYVVVQALISNVGYSAQIVNNLSVKVIRSNGRYINNEEVTEPIKWQMVKKYNTKVDSVGVMIINIVEMTKEDYDCFLETRR